MEVRVGGFVELSTVDTDGVAFSVFFQGCRKRCVNCHNPELQPFEGSGVLTNTDDILKKILDYRHWYDSVAFLGGEPLEQPLALKELLTRVREEGLHTWLYTGYEMSEIPADIFNLCSVIVAGEYREELKTGGFPSSSNQTVLDRRIRR